MPQCLWLKNDEEQCQRQASRRLGHDPQFCWQHQRSGGKKAISPINNSIKLNQMIAATKIILDLTEEEVQTCINLASEPELWTDIVITVPHSVCPGNNVQQHLCDFAASSFALDLQSHLSAQLVKSQFSRIYCDLNRPCCRNPHLLVDFLSKIKVKDGTLILDVHSFPSDSDTSEVIFLDPKDGFFSYTKDLTIFLLKRGINAAIARASVINNIIISALFLSSNCSKKVVSCGGILIEINEGVSKKRRSYIAKVISDWVNLHISRHPK